MLEEGKAARAYELFDAAFIRGEGSIESILELRDLLAQATEPQRVWITREIDTEAQDDAVRRAMCLIRAIIEIADPLRELVLRRYRGWVVYDAAREGFAPPGTLAADAAAIDAQAALPPRKLSKRCRAPRRVPGRSHDNSRPWSTRLEPPDRSS